MDGGVIFASSATSLAENENPVGPARGANRVFRVGTRAIASDLAEGFRPGTATSAGLPNPMAGPPCYARRFRSLVM